MTSPDIFEMIREPFAREFGLPACERGPERSVNPPVRQMTSIDLAEKRLKTSLTALDKSEYWKCLRENILDSLDSASVDQIAKHCLDDDAFALKQACDSVIKKAIRATADQNIDELGACV